MTLGFDDIFAADGVLYVQMLGGEPVVYQRKDGFQKAFDALVYREPAANTAETAGRGFEKMPQSAGRVFIPFDAAGINGLSAPPDRGGKESLFISDVRGGRIRKWRPITDIRTSDSGGWEVDYR
jgi:hypothetical protein